MLIPKSYLVQNPYRCIFLYAQALRLYIKELAVLFPKTTQKHLGKKFFYIYFISLAMRLFQEGCPSLPIQVMADINFIPSNLSLPARLSCQQAVLLLAGKIKGGQIKGVNWAGCCPGPVLFSAWRCKARTHCVSEQSPCMLLTSILTTVY